MNTISPETNPKLYGIKASYRPNAAVITHDDLSGQTYWNEARLDLSRSYQYPVYMLAKDLILRTGARRVVDVGCGVATKLELLHRQLPTVEFVGIDQPNAIAFCQQRYRFGRWLVDDLERPHADLSGLAGDLVICSDVIEHLGDPDVLLRYLKLCVRPGGAILLSTPERDALRGRACTSSPNKYHVREWNGTELRTYLEQSGFRVVRQWLQLPVKAELSRLFFSHVVMRALRGRPVKWNQVCLLEIA